MRKGLTVADRATIMESFSGTYEGTVQPDNSTTLDNSTEELAKPGQPCPYSDKMGTKPPKNPKYIRHP